MKLIVLSDSHGDLNTVEKIKSLQADAIFHCGDSELSAEDPLLNGIHIVRGNCDGDDQFPATIVQKVGDETIFIVHGHEHDVKRSMLTLSYAAAEQQATIALFGHSHLYGAEMINGVLFINPGSTTQPRGGRVATYAVIEIDDAYTVSFYSMNHELIDQIILNK
ncbi:MULTISPECIES: metallophosphoesterase [unclassified Sporosarcina]|uniref:metallophosphoesterase n=1 Tax=unclassified Sporosarcina TaxID=2647733 RepID=UPI000C16F5C5|nr:MULTISPECIES: metallophosphoesterase [unclassified Sporosarcina]PID07246.1 YfcE family phosphodiesterase [Sporosarcina sp. P30]PID10442.1 YfcE family phosphodiesterase [Sporosarcina sp. P31]PID13027.1 YfcE family phosphodiesterase [Sporosarcina sp. P32b]